MEMLDSGSLQGATTGFSFVLNFLNFKRSEESEMTSWGQIQFRSIRTFKQFLQDLQGDLQDWNRLI